MTATTLLNELRMVGVIVNATPDGGLELDAPRGVLTEARLTALRQYKAEIIVLLSCRCPLCRSYGMRQEQSVKEGLLYIDTLCVTCDELIECFVPAQQNINNETDAAA
jgi:hypothetical protein